MNTAELAKIVDDAWERRAEIGLKTKGPVRKAVEEAIALLRSKQQPDGTWMLENTHRGQVHFALEDGDGRPSRWNTLRALRVLDWYEQSAT